MEKLPTLMNDEFLKNTDNWLDYGLCDHLEDEKKFKDYIEVAWEVARICEAEKGSPMYDLLLSLAAASAKLGFNQSGYDPEKD